MRGVIRLEVCMKKNDSQSSMRRNLILIIARQLSLQETQLCGRTIHAQKQPMSCRQISFQIVCCRSGFRKQEAPRSAKILGSRNERVGRPLNFTPGSRSRMPEVKHERLAEPLAEQPFSTSPRGEKNECEKEPVKVLVTTGRSTFTNRSLPAENKPPVPSRA